MTVPNTSAYSGQRWSPQVTPNALARIASCFPNHGFTIAAAKQIDRECDSRRTSTLCALHDLFCDGPVALMVELKPNGSAARGDAVFD